MLRSDGFFLVTTLLQALTPLWSFLPLFSSSLPLVQLTHLLDSLPDVEESLILTGIRTAVNQHMLSQHALLSSLTPTLWKWIGIFCVPHWTTTFPSYRLSVSM